MTRLRDDLLSARSVALAGAVAPAVRDLLARLGSQIEELGPELDEQAAEAWVRSRLPLHALVYDASGPFGHGGQAGLESALESGWIAIRALASVALIAAQEASGPAGKIVLLAPRPDSGLHAEPVRAALENLARTLSVEWARYEILVTMVAPGAATSDQEVAELVAFLLSSAGDYFSGCRFALGARAPSG